SARVLADVVSREPLAGRRVIELGAGLGLPSIAAVSAGARVLATDWYPEALGAARANARAAGLGLRTMLVDWFAPPYPLPGPGRRRCARGRARGGARPAPPAPGGRAGGAPRRRPPPIGCRPPRRGGDRRRLAPRAGGHCRRRTPGRGRPGRPPPPPGAARS